MASGQTVNAVPAPDPHSLLPPLLASLPTAFASSRPPPDFLNFLSPILRQRLQIHTSTPSSSHDSWLRLLCWDNVKAEQLKEHVENTNFEPHPSSGEIEVGDLGTITYRKFDAETLKAQIPLLDWELTAMYLWCAGEAREWKLAELLPFDMDLSRNSAWAQSISEAEAALKPASTSKSLLEVHAPRKASVPGEDDDYWAMYDQTPGRTPARQGSINPLPAGATEEDYYAQYGEVQPAMDNHDPDEVHEEAGESSLNGHALQDMLAKNSKESEVDKGLPAINPVLDTRGLAPPNHDGNEHVSHPIPASPSSRAGSDTVARLEQEAERSAAAEMGIRQHISTTMKSMYRLAKSAGMSRDDFDRMVQRELEALSIFDRDD